jgi:hypothetical protein
MNNSMQTLYMGGGMENVKKQRGGKREGAGRVSTLGPTVRRDLRVPDYIEREAIRLGRGNFSTGMRAMCDEYLALRERHLPVEAPPLGTAVLVYITDDARWTVAVPEKGKGGLIVFREDCTVCGKSTMHVAERWRPLPAPGAVLGEGLPLD